MVKLLKGVESTDACIKEIKTDLSSMSQSTSIKQLEYR